MGTAGIRGFQLGLSAREANLLAQLSFWVLVQEKDLVRSMLA